MARVAGIYSVPAGTDGVPDQTVDSSKYNAFIHDIESDLNTPRPISAGGTGSNSAAGALAALGGETAAQLVADYSTFVFAAGSFYSAAGANAAPTAAAFQGICYANPAGTELYLEGRELATNARWYRRKTAGSWGTWSQDASTDASKVLKAGDTMTGNLVIAPVAGLGSLTIAPTAAGALAQLLLTPGINANAQLQLNKATGSQVNRIIGSLSSLTHWVLNLSDATSRLSVERYSVAGALLDTPFYIDGVDGRIYTAGISVTQGNQVATKTYVDAGDTGSLKIIGGQTVTGGFKITPYSLGTAAGTVTPDPFNANYQYITNNAAFTLAAPASDCALDLLITNGATAGVVTFSGFTASPTGVGDALNNTNNAKFLVSIRRINAIAFYTIKQVA